MRELSEGKKALAAISGGVDSTISALLARQALGERVFPVLIDTGFMREDEPEKVRDKLASPPLELKIRIVRSAGRFLKAVADEPIAEEKRKKFPHTFNHVLKEEADKFGCEYLVQGTIAPDWIETQGGIKTQHNVLEQVGIDPHTRYGFKIMEPLSELYKDQVRSLAKHLAVPNEFSQRQPFPGPGLLVRCIGEVRKPKLDVLKRVTSIVEDRLGAVGSNQYFAAIIENKFANEPLPKAIRKVAADTLDLPVVELQSEAFMDRVTGVKADERAYARLASIALRNKTRDALGWFQYYIHILQSMLVASY